MSPGCGCILLGEGLRDVTQTFVQTEVQSGRHGDASSARIFGRNLHRRREVYPVITLAGDYILCNVCVLRLYILVYTFLYILRFFGPSSTGSVGTFLASQSSHSNNAFFYYLAERAYFQFSLWFRIAIDISFFIIERRTIRDTHDG